MQKFRFYLTLFICFLAACSVHSLFDVLILTAFLVFIIWRTS